MRIVLNNTGKRFNREWIFRKLSKAIEHKSKTVILGSNGSGKSTLLQIISGFTTPSEGSLTYELHGQIIKQQDVFKHVAVVAPYLDLFEDFTLRESLSFQSDLKPFQEKLDLEKIEKLLMLEGQSDKKVKHFSSGMKQRLKLGLGVLTSAELLLLDEPTSNLDHQGIAWYKGLIEAFTKDKTILVCSNNQSDEFEFCNHQIQIEEFK